MAIKKAISGNAYKHNGATVLWGGAANTSQVNAPVTAAPGNAIIGVRTGTQMATTLLIGSGVKAAITGDFAKMTQGRYVMQGNTGYLAGNVSTKINTGGSLNSASRSIHWKENQRSLLQVTAGWNYVTGQFLTAPTSQNDTYKSIDGGAVVDQEDRPSRAVPGEFTFRYGAFAPSGAKYKANVSS